MGSLWLDVTVALAALRFGCLQALCWPAPAGHPQAGQGASSLCRVPPGGAGGQEGARGGAGSGAATPTAPRAPGEPLRIQELFW